MKTKILSGLICCLGIFSANAQTITAPVGQNLTITNPVDVTGAGNSVNIPSDGSFKIGGTNILKTVGANLFLGNAGNITTTGSSNLFLGSTAGNANTTGDNNIFTGVGAGLTNTTGFGNIFSGSNSGNLNTTGFNNIFLGTTTGPKNTTGSNNIFVGVSAGFNNTTGNNNLFLGALCGLANTTGSYNFFLGSGAGSLNTTGNNNLFLGINAGYGNTTGTNNFYAGQDAGLNNTTGSSNLFLGVSAGSINTSGSSNTYVGFASGGTAAITNTTAIGAGAQATVSNSVVLGNAATTVTGVGLGTGLSGLKFANLTSAASPVITSGNNKVLSVDGVGNVILVSLANGVTTNGINDPIAENWKESEGYLYNNSTNGVVIKGTGLDGNALIVKGGVLSKEVNVKVEGSEAWPDYVFKPTYKRMSLGEVEKFIAINGHLPNVPSATEMAISGNNLGKTDVKLLEKVEELTLYLLDMKKVNDAQAAELKSLKKQVSKLRKK